MSGYIEVMELLYIFYKDRSVAFPTTCLEVIDIMLSEINEIWKDIYYIASLISGI